MYISKYIRIVDMTRKFVLADLVLGKSQFPERTLKAVFQGAFQELEVLNRAEFPSDVKEKVWKKISPEKLETIRDLYLIEVCKKILWKVSDEEVENMIKGQRAFLPHDTLNRIEESVTRVAVSMAGHITCDIIDEVKNES